MKSDRQIIFLTFDGTDGAKYTCHTWPNSDVVPTALTVSVDMDSGEVETGAHIFDSAIGTLHGAGYSRKEEGLSTSLTPLLDTNDKVEASTIGVDLVLRESAEHTKVYLNKVDITPHVKHIFWGATTDDFGETVMLNMAVKSIDARVKSVIEKDIPENLEGGISSEETVSPRASLISSIQKLGRLHCFSKEEWPDPLCGCTIATSDIMKYNEGTGCAELKQVYQLLTNISDEEFERLMKGD